MRRLLLSAILLLISLLLEAQVDSLKNGYVKFKYPNGIVSSEGTMRDGKPDGYWKSYYETGILKSEGNRKNFLLDSTWNFYNSEGLLVSIINYKNGIKDGERITFLENEILIELFQFDVKQGVSKILYKEGSLKKTIPFTDGLENGLSFEYALDSTIISVSEYKKGLLLSRESINRTDRNGFKQGSWKIFYDNGFVKEEVTYRNGKKNGFEKKYDISGSLISVVKYEDDILVENAEEIKEYVILYDYYPSGRIKISGSYYNDKPDGIRREYNEEGAIIKGYIFNNGILLADGITDHKGLRQGHWKEYYESGELLAEGDYNNSIKVGIWKYYHRNGKIEQQGEYDSRGRAVNEWNWYYSSGNILRTETFEANIQEGEVLEYSDSGSVIVRGQYEDGEETGKWTYIIGDVTEEGNYEAGTPVGIWTQRDNDTGEIIYKGNYIDGQPDGRHVYNFSDGRRKLEGYYIMGRREGDWKYFNTDGTIFLIITYRNGIEIRYNNVIVKPEISDTDAEN